MVEGEEQPKTDENSEYNSSIVVVEGEEIEKECENENVNVNVNKKENERENENENENENEKTQEQKMDNDSTDIPSWFTPKRFLALFCVINVINYVDRGTIASNGVNGERRTCEGGKCTNGFGIQGQFDLNNFQDGVISSAFMVGLLLACPVFATLAKSVNPFRLIGFGLLFWTAAVIGCGFSWHFWSISIFRMLVGVGEASFISLASPFIDNYAPDSQRTSWLALFFMCMPVGYAFGYIFGGLVGSHLTWRWAFFFEAMMMAPFVILGFVMKPLPLKGFAPPASKKASLVETKTQDSKIPITDDCISDEGRTDNLDDASQSEENAFKRFFSDLKLLLVEKVFVVNVLGYIAYNFVLGAYSYWGPKAAYNIYNMANADMIFGGITVGCGLVGTIGGGLLLDYVISTISNAFKLLSVATLFGAAFCFTAFCFKKEILFLIFYAIGELLLFATLAPTNFVSLRCVKPSLRPLSMAMTTVSIHVFGDVPSSPLVGVLQDHIDNWRKTALILTSILFLAAVFWFIGVFLRNSDFNNESEHDVTRANGANKSQLSEEA